MPKLWNLGEMTASVKLLLHSNTTQTNQAFIGPAGDLNQYYHEALNEVCEEELEEVQMVADRRHFFDHYQFVWPANQLTYTFPNNMGRDQMESLYDVTNNQPGTSMTINSTRDGGIFWKKHDTLQWMRDGPNEAKTIEVTYIAEHETMTLDADEPVLIPRKHRTLLVWGAAIYMRTYADEAAPKEWLRKREEKRARFKKTLTKGRPMQGGRTGIRRTQRLVG
jgi:hypothetical protein